MHRKNRPAQFLVAGTVLFFAPLGLSSATTESLVPRYEVLAKSGDPISPGADIFFKRFTQSSLMADARVAACEVALQGAGVTPDNQFGIWQSENGHIQVRSGEWACWDQGTATPLYFRKFDSLRITPTGDVQFLVTLSPENTTATLKKAFFPSWFSHEPLLTGDWVSWNVRSLLCPSAMPQEVTCTAISGFSARINESNFVVAATFSGPGLDDSNNEAIVTPSSISVRKGDATYGTGGSCIISSLSTAFQNSAPGYVFRAPVTPSGTDGIWQTGSANYSTPYAYKRVQVGDTFTQENADYKILGVRDPACALYHDTSLVAVVENLSTNSSFEAVLNASTFYYGDELRLVKKQGDPAPVSEPNTVFASFDSPMPGQYSFPSGTLPVTFLAKLSGPSITTENDFGVFVVGEDGECRTLLREGDSISLSKNDTRVVQSFVYTPWSVNLLGAVSLGVDFTDGSSALLIADFVPAPTPGTTPDPDTIETQSATPPVVKFKGAKPDGTPRKITRKNVIVIRGTASSEDALRQIEWKLGAKDRIHRIEGQGQWQLRIPLQAGTNIVFVRAITETGAASDWRRMVIIRR
jgi:hypothetical protein